MLISKGKTEGLLTTEEISDTLSGLELPKDQIENIFNIIDKLEIEIVSEEDEDRDLLKRKLDLNIKSPISDPVRMYLKEIGKVRLLTATEEVQLSKRIEVVEPQKKSKQQIFTSKDWEMSRKDVK